MAKPKRPLFAVEHVAIDQLNPAVYNPRRATQKQVEDVRASLARFGFVDPLVVNSNPERYNIVIGGHLRLRVAREMGHESVPVHYVNLNEEQERELNLRLNKNVGEWDWDMLASFEVPMLVDVGFTVPELNTNFGLAPGQPGTSAADEWDGMPQFTEESKEAFRYIVIHFKDQQGVDEFAAKLGRAISAKARYLWYPDIDIEHVAHTRYVATDGDDEADA